MTSASLPGAIFDTLPKRTLLTYFVPSAVMTTPSLPASFACSVFVSLPALSNVSTSLVPMFTTTTLPCAVDRDAVRQSERRAVDEHGRAPPGVTL